MRSNFEKRLYQLESQSQRVQMENEMLKSMVVQSRQDQTRMQDKVHKALYQIVQLFGNTNGQLPPALQKSSVGSRTRMFTFLFVWRFCIV
jgi:uncharacterized coiled-coil protein SlyX